MVKPKKLLVLTLVTLSSLMSVPVMAASHRGGQWTYGGYHDPANWGAISNYYHGTRYHWSYVGSTVRNNQRTGYAGAQSTSYAFINTSVGESVVFDAGW